MQRKWIFVIGFIAIIIVVSGVGFYSFLGGQIGGDLLSPPVDVSGINLSSDITREDLLPDQLVGESLNTETVVGGWKSGSGYGYVQTTEAEYGGVTLHVWKAATEQEATSALEDYYDDPFDFFYSGSTQKTGTQSWFTFDGSGISGFAWTSGVWIFGVEAENAQTRNQAATEWMQELRNR